MVRLDGRLIPDGYRGRIVPYLCGFYNRVECLPFSVGLVDRLGATIEEEGAVSVIKLSRERIVQLLPSSGRVKIDSELFDYTGKNPSRAQLTGVIRETGDTDAARHLIGASVFQQVSQQVYIAGENPRLSHFTKSVHQTFIQGRPHDPDNEDEDLQDPPVVINLDNRNLIPPYSVVSLTFDTSGNTKGAPGSTSTSPAFIPVTTTPPNVGGNGHYSGLQLVNGVWGYYPTMSSSPAPELSPVEVTGVGLQDDTLGTVGGSPGTALTIPANIVRLIIREAYGERDDTWWDLASFNEARTLTGRIQWGFGFQPSSLTDFLFQAGLHSRSDIATDAGFWRMRYRKKRPTVYSLGARTIKNGRASWSSLEDITNVLPVAWGSGLNQDTFTLTEPASKNRFGVRRAVDTLQLPWLTREIDANFLGKYWLSQWSFPRLQWESELPWDGIALQKTDPVALETPILSPFSTTVTRVQVRGVWVDPATGTMRLTGTDDLTGLELPIGVAVLLPAEIELPIGVAVYQAAPIVVDSLAAGTLDAATTARLLALTDPLPIGVADAAAVLGLPPGAESLPLGLTESVTIEEPGGAVAFKFVSDQPAVGEED
jgi:hypothetical protein